MSAVPSGHQPADRPSATPVATEEPAASALSVCNALLDRCRQMGLPAWVVSRDGTILEEPSAGGAAGAWLRTPLIRSAISRAARSASRRNDLICQRLFPGCRALLVIDETTARGMVALLMDGSVCHALEFIRACQEANVSPREVWAGLCCAESSEAAFATVATSAARIFHQDARTLAEYAHAIRSFTVELTRSYETIDLLYTLGRSMLDLEHPERFVALMCDRLIEAAPFAWLVVRFTPQAPLAGPLAGRTLWRGLIPDTPEALEPHLARLAEQTSRQSGQARIVAGPDAEALGSTQVLVQPIGSDRGVAGIIACGNKRGEDFAISTYDMHLIEAATGYISAMLENAHLYREQQRLFLGTLRSLTAAIDAKDNYTWGHSERVALLAAALARAAGMSPDQTERVHVCGLVHDVGKIGVPEAVLCKPTALTSEEFALIRQHPEIGYRILKDIPMLADVLPGVLHHHERWDGTGYPRGLRGEEIPLIARIICLADTFDAMSSTRAYRSAISRRRVLAEIERCAGSQFDPALAPLFVRLDFSEYDAMAARHAREARPAQAPPPAVAA